MLQNTKETEIPEAKHTVDAHIRSEDEICQIDIFSALPYSSVPELSQIA